MNGWSDFLGRALPVLFASGLVAGAFRLLNRRSEVRNADATARKLETESGNMAIDSAARSLALSDLVRDQSVARAEQAVIRADQAVARADKYLSDLGIQTGLVEDVTRRLARAEAEVVSLRGEMTILRQALAVSNGHLIAAMNPLPAANQLTNDL